METSISETQTDHSLSLFNIPFYPYRATRIHSVDPDEMACNEQSYQGLHSLSFSSRILLTPPVATMDVSKIKMEESIAVTQG